MKKFIFALSLFLYSFSFWLIETTDASELNRIVFLSSFNEENKKPELSTQFELLLREYFDESKFEVIIKRNADKYDLWQALHASNNTAVFWVSHASIQVENTGSLIGGDVIDVTGANVADFFRDVSPNIAWIGLIGCNTRKLIDLYRSEGSYLNNPNLIIDSFNTSVEVLDGVNSSFKRAIQHLNKLSERFSLDSSCSPQLIKGIRLNIIRDIPVSAQINDLTSVRLEKKGQTLVVFPAGAPGDTQIISIIFPITNSIDPSEYTLTLSTGRKSEATGITTPALGKLSIYSFNRELKWEPVLAYTGKYLGRNQNVYVISKGVELPSDANLLILSNFLCKSSNKEGISEK